MEPQALGGIDAIEEGQGKRKRTYGAPLPPCHVTNVSYKEDFYDIIFMQI